MLLKGSTLAHLFILATTTGDLTAEGKAQQRVAVRPEHARGYATIIPKLRECIEIAVLREGVEATDFKEGESVPLEKVEWVKLADVGQRKELSNRFVESDITLTDKEVAFIKYAIKTRDEQPTADVETLDELAALGLEE